MRFRDKVALVAIAIILQTVCILSVPPKNLRKGSAKQYLKNTKTSNRFPGPKRQPFATERQSMPKIKDLPMVDYTSEYTFPHQVSTNPSNAESFFLNKGPKIKNLEDTKLLNDLRKERRRKRKNNYHKTLNEAPKDAIKTNDPIYLTQIGTFPEMQYPLTVSETWGPNYWNPLTFNVEDPYHRSDDDIVKNYIQKNKNVDFKPITTKVDSELFTFKKKSDIEKSSKIIDSPVVDEKEANRNIVENPAISEPVATKEKTQSRPKITRKIKIVTKSRPKPKISNDNIKTLADDNNLTCVSDHVSNFTCSIIDVENKTIPDVKLNEEVIKDENNTVADLPPSDFELCFTNSNNTNLNTNGSLIPCVASINEVMTTKETENIGNSSVKEINVNDGYLESFNVENVDEIPDIDNDLTLSQISGILTYDNQLSNNATEGIEEKNIFEQPIAYSISDTDKITVADDNTTIYEIISNDTNITLNELTKLEPFDTETTASKEEVELSVDPDIILLDLERAIIESKSDGTIDRLIPKIKQAILEAIIESAAYVPSSVLSNTFPTEKQSDNNIPTDPNTEYEFIDDRYIVSQDHKVNNQKYVLSDERPAFNSEHTETPHQDAVVPKLALQNKTEVTEPKLSKDNKESKQTFNIDETIQDTINPKGEEDNCTEFEFMKTSNKNNEKVHSADNQKLSSSNNFTKEEVHKNTSSNITSTTYVNEYNTMEYLDQEKANETVLDQDLVQHEYNANSVLNEDSETLHGINETNNNHGDIKSVSTQYKFHNEKNHETDMNIILVDSKPKNSNLTGLLSNAILGTNKIDNNDHYISIINYTRLSQVEKQTKQLLTDIIENYDKLNSTLNRYIQLQKAVQNEAEIMTNQNLDGSNIKEQNILEQFHEDYSSYEKPVLIESILPTNATDDSGINSSENIMEENNVRNDTFSEPLQVDLYPVYDFNTTVEEKNPYTDSFVNFLNTSNTKEKSKLYNSQIDNESNIDLASFEAVLEQNNRLSVLSDHVMDTNDYDNSCMSEAVTDSPDTVTVADEDVQGITNLDKLSLDDFQHNVVMDSNENLSLEPLQQNEDGLVSDHFILVPNDYSNQGKSVKISQCIDKELKSNMSSEFFEDELKYTVDQNNKDCTSPEELKETDLSTDPLNFDVYYSSTDAVLGSSVVEEMTKSELSNQTSKETETGDKFFNRNQTNISDGIISPQQQSEEKLELTKSEINDINIKNDQTQELKDRNDSTELVERMIDQIIRNLSSNENVHGYKYILDPFLKDTDETENAFPY